MSLSPANKKLSVWKGGTYRKVLTLHTGSSASTPARDLTDYTAQLRVHDVANEATVLLSLTTVNGGIVLGGTAGTISLFITDEATGAFTWKKGKYQLTITNSAGDTDPLLYGVMEVRSY